MKVDAVYRQEVLSIDAEAVLVEAAAQMDFQEVGALAVLEPGSLLGIVTERRPGPRHRRGGRPLPREGRRVHGAFPGHLGA